MIRVDEDELEYTDESIYIWQGKPFTGIGYECLPNGALISEVSYVDGIQRGIAREWYSSGQLHVEEHYFDGSKHGEYHEWFENGQLKTETVYEFSILVKKKVWDEKGSLVKEFEISESDSLYSTLKVFRETKGSSNSYAKE